MISRNHTVFAFLLICANSYAQIINHGVPTAGTRQQPQPGEARIKTKEILRMKTVDLEMKVSGPIYMLKVSDKEIYGPFKYSNGEKIGNKTDHYTIIEAFDNSFTLKSPKTSKTFGPFKLGHGEKIKTDTASFEIMMEYGYIGGAVNHPGCMTKNNPIYLILIGTDIYNDMSALMYQFMALDQQHELYKAPRKTVRPTTVSITGQINDGTINRSKADIAKNSRSMDAQAKASFQSFCKKHAYKTVKPNYKGIYTFGKLAPGRYMVCCEATKRNEDGNKLIRSRPTFWWTGVSVEAGDHIQLDFTGENDLDWRDLFVKENSK